MIKITAVWKQTTKTGVTYYKGKLGDGDILLFPNKSDHPKAPDFDVLIAKREKQEGYQGSAENKETSDFGGKE